MLPTRSTSVAGGARPPVVDDAPAAPDWDEVNRVTPLLRFLGFRYVPSDDPDVHSIAMDVTPDTLSTLGQPHGGALATLIDHTGGHAAVALLGRSGPTLDLHVRYLTAPRGATVRADARIVRAGRNVLVIEVEVRDGEERLVATGTLSALATISSSDG
jgi:uncharacterized protein (TIGR00369 family)